MSIEALRAALPGYARDIATNLAILAGEAVLPDQAKWGCFDTSAHAVGELATLRAIETAAAAAGLSPEAFDHLARRWRPLGDDPTLRAVRTPLGWRLEIPANRG